LKIIASPLVGAGAGQLSPEEAAALLVQTFPSNDSDGFPAVLRIVLEADADRQAVESILRRTV
jgi:O-acetyl-ADP-ribose deacetylase (regulator of RNase III)